MSRPARIVFVDHTARLGGGEIALFHLVRTLDRACFEPVVLLFSTGPLQEQLSAVRIETHVLSLDGDVADARKDSLGGGSLLRVGAALKTLAFVWRARSVIRRLRPDLVHTNSLKAHVIGGVSAKLAGVPVIWHVRDRIADDYLPARVARVIRWLARRVPTAIIANSGSTLKALTGTENAPAESGTPANWTVVHDGIPDVAVPAQGPAAVGLLVGLVGRLARWKGQHVFIRAIAELRPQFPDARFQIIGSALFGEDAYVQELHDLVTSHGLQDVVEFTGFREDVGAAIAALDVLVHASITGEPFGQVIIEGMTAGKPVVATHGGGVPEIVNDGETGILVPMGDAPALAQAIGRLLSDADLRADLGRRGRERVLAHFTIRHTARGVERVYARVLASADNTH